MGTCHQLVAHADGSTRLFVRSAASDVPAAATPQELDEQVRRLSRPSAPADKPHDHHGS
jgi:hypothetical protein